MFVSSALFKWRGEGPPYLFIGKWWCLILHVKGPPHLALGDAPHPTCRDTQSSEDLSAYFPQTPDFHSHCMGTTSDLTSTKPTRRVQEFQGMFPRRLSTFQIVKMDSIKCHIHSHPNLNLKAHFHFFSSGQFKVEQISQWVPPSRLGRPVLFLDAICILYFPHHTFTSDTVWDWGTCLTGCHICILSTHTFVLKSFIPRIKRLSNMTTTCQFDKAVHCILSMGFTFEQASHMWQAWRYHTCDKHEGVTHVTSMSIVGVTCSFF